MTIPNSIQARLSTPMTSLGYDFVHTQANQVIHTGEIRVNTNGEVVFNDVSYPDGIRLSDIVKFREHIKEDLGNDLKSKHLKFKDNGSENAISLIDIRNHHLNDESYEYWWSLNRKYDFVKDANVHVLSGGDALMTTLNPNFKVETEVEGTVSSGWSVKEFFKRQYALAQNKNKNFRHRNFWFDVPGMSLVTPPYMEGKSCFVEFSFPLRIIGDAKKFIALRIIDVTTGIELTRTHWTSDEFEHDVYMCYRGELPDTNLDVSSSNNCECIFDLSSQQTFEFDLPSVKKSIPSDQHILMLQFSIVDESEHIQEDDGTISKIVNVPDFYFGGGTYGSIDFMGFQKHSDDFLFQQNGIYLVDGDESASTSIDIDRMTDDNYTLAFSSNKNIDIWVESQTRDSFNIKWSPALPSAVIDWQLNAVEKQNNKIRYSTNHWKFRESYFNISNVESHLEVGENNTLTGILVGIDLLLYSPTIVAIAVQKENGPSPTTPIIKTTFPSIDGSWIINNVDPRFDYSISVDGIPTITPIPLVGAIVVNFVITDPTMNASISVGGTINTN